MAPQAFSNAAESKVKKIVFWSKAKENKAGYTATLVACGWAGVVIKKVTEAFWRERSAQNAQECKKTRKGTNRLTDRLTNQRT